MPPLGTTSGETSERKSNVGGEAGVVGGGGITTKRKLLSTQQVGEVFEPYSNHHHRHQKHPHDDVGGRERKKTKKTTLRIMTIAPAGGSLRRGGEEVGVTSRAQSLHGRSDEAATSSLSRGGTAAVGGSTNPKNVRRNAKNLARRKRNSRKGAVVGSVTIGGADPKNGGEGGSDGGDKQGNPILLPNVSSDKSTMVDATNVPVPAATRHHHGVPRGRRCVAASVIEQRIRSIGKDDRVDLPKELINSLPSTQYPRTKNAIVVICTAIESDRAVANIRAELLSTKKDDHYGMSLSSFHYVGFDTETRPKFYKGGKNHPPALLQIATETTAYLFRLVYVQGNHYRHNGTDTAMTTSLISLLSDPTIIKVGVGIHADIKELYRVYGPDTCGDGMSYLDLAPLVGQRWPAIRRAGLRNLTATVLGYRLSKAQQMRNWEMEHLTSAMMDYAAADAFVALDLLTAIIGDEDQHRQQQVRQQGHAAVEKERWEEKDQK